MKRSGLLLLTLALAACGSAGHVATNGGTLPPGSHMLVRVERGEIDAYKPKVGDLSDQYTLQTSSTQDPPPQPSLTRNGKTLGVSFAPGSPGELLVRVPDRVSLDASSGEGDVNITDITGIATAHAGNGNVKVMVEGYAQASSGAGDVTVYMGSTNWPGTLHFASDRGDVEVWINATANFHVRMHTDRGTIFTDFALRGTSSGTSETIVGNVGDANERSIDIEARDGSIRLLQLKPQI
ncbi:MAG TPA: DUF4097 family beta strand repeat-containing protein [Verrucomicrobiae bacterium]|nr:DUF4097 family beta strand repeat-containing protein [Verrucomicrobiae bacterium]